MTGFAMSGWEISGRSAAESNVISGNLGNGVAINSQERNAFASNKLHYALRVACPLQSAAIGTGSTARNGERWKRTK
jgi:hypothetical protein